MKWTETRKQKDNLEHIFNHYIIFIKMLISNRYHFDHFDQVICNDRHFGKWKRAIYFNDRQGSNSLSPPMYKQPYLLACSDRLKLHGIRSSFIILLRQVYPLAIPPRKKIVFFLFKVLDLLSKWGNPTTTTAALGQIGSMPINYMLCHQYLFSASVFFLLPLISLFHFPKKDWPLGILSGVIFFFLVPSSYFKSGNKWWVLALLYTMKLKGQFQICKDHRVCSHFCQMQWSHCIQTDDNSYGKSTVTCSYCWWKLLLGLSCDLSGKLSKLSEEKWSCLLQF